MNDDKLSIRLTIADRTYPLTIPQSEEEAIRKMAKQVNATILQYSQRFPGKEMQDYMAMTLLHYALQLHSLSKQQDVKEMIAKIEHLDKELEMFLVQEQVL